MFGIEKLISKPFMKWIEEADGLNETTKRVKIVMSSYFSCHLILVILNLILFGVLSYKICKKKKKQL